MIHRFSTISQINTSDSRTWRDNIFLTFDTDWACEAIVEDTLSLLSEFEIATTWFVTGKYSCLEQASHAEIALHPNFNNLFSGDPSAPMNDRASKILEDLLCLYPASTAIRSHSLLQSERLLDLFAEYRLTHVCNHYIPFSSNIALAPFRLWGGLTMVPHGFQDNAAIRTKEVFPDIPLQALLSRLYVFDFHPIHIFLNTEDLSRYEATRPFHQDPRELIKYRYHGDGTRNRLIRLLKASTAL
jgi:hypothetical protein